MVEPESPKALANVLITAARDPGLLSRLAEAAEPFARAHFSAEAMVDAFESLMESCLRD